MRYSNLIKIAALSFFLASCHSPEERATGEPGGSRDDSMTNSQPLSDPNAKPATIDTNDTNADTLASDSSRFKH